MNNLFVVMKVTHLKGKEYEVILKDELDQVKTLQVHEELVLKYRLVIGKELTSDILKELNAKLDLGKAYQYALNVLSKKSYTVDEMRQKFLTKQYSGDMIDELIEKLCDVNLLNDETYTIAYLTQSARSGKKGPKLLRNELSKKGISSELISKHLALYSEDDELENAKRIALQQLKSNTKYGPHFLKQKIGQSLALKGFSRSVCDAAMSSLVFEEKQEGNPILQKEMEKLFRKHTRLEGYEHKMKISQALARKGFSFDEINDVYAQVKEMNEED